MWRASRAGGVGRPGIGFGTATTHVLALLDALGVLMAMPYPVVIGSSGKAVNALFADYPTPPTRLAGPLAVAAPAPPLRDAAWAQR
ncbi:hypothetical protein [Nocardia grenadensis]|uniref:hypothetical protein n=1 Tax=Nocardia grenadensis TaxID=931537 RepID=UPI0007A4AC6D|nr:hypothetical protein [Nocardia grenadensis]